MPYDANQTVDILSAVTEWKTSTAELLKVAERTLIMVRSFNIREGLTVADDKPSNRFF